MKTKCIFIIEDNKVFRKITKLVLEANFSERIVSFQSAEEALAEMDVYNPDIVLLDYNLSSKKSDNMSGLEFMSKNNGRDKKPVVIIISGQESKSVATSLLKAGAVNYLEKDKESFFEVLVAEVRKQLKVLGIHKELLIQRMTLRKQLFRTKVFLLIPISIVIFLSFIS